jgi:hypothetical protein
MNDYKRQKHKEFILRYAEKFKDKIELNSKERDHLFKALIELHEIPFPAKELQRFFLHSHIIADLLVEVLNSNSLTPDDRHSIYKSFNGLHKLLRRKKSGYSINFRLLAPSGNYPNVELERESSRYTFTNQLPVLITKSRNKKDTWADTSLINWLTRTELKFATAVMCAPKSGLFHFQFTSHNSIKIDYDCYRNIPSSLQVYFLRELLDIHSKFSPIGKNAWSRKPLADVAEYEFSDFQGSIGAFKDLFANFSIRNDLLLRTCNYFVKARMHWDNQIFAEEAIINTFMCLEGCLHLIQKKYGDPKPKLNRVLLKSVFIKDFPNGENLYDYIEEGYEKRITLIHPEPKWGAAWDPFITSEDFYDYYKICRVVLNFILIDRHLDDY